MSQAMTQATTTTRPRRGFRLRELGIYALSTGGEYVVSTIYSDGCCLYTTRSWGIYGEAEFWVDGEGRLLRRGVPTRWSARDLTDTGRTEQYPKPVLH